MKEKTIKMPETIHDGRLDLILAILDLIQSKQSEAKILFDFQKTKVIEASGYAILCCLSDALREHQKTSGVFGLQKIKHAEFIRKLLENKPSNTFLPIVKMKLVTPTFILKGLEQCIDPSFNEDLDQIFMASLGEEKLWYVRLILNELMQNAMDHATSERYFLYAGFHESHFQFGVCDMGVSIPAKLEQKYNCMDDFSYLKKSLEFGVGTRRARPGGLGLNHMFEALKSQKGRLVILSRNAQLRIYFNRRKTEGGMLKKPLRGTWCMARFLVGRKS